MSFSTKIFTAVIAAFVLPLAVAAQEIRREFAVPAEPVVEIRSDKGKIRIEASAANEKIVVIASSVEKLPDSSLKTVANGSTIKIETSSARRIDLTVLVPERSRTKLRTLDGEITASGNFRSITAETDSGTIAVDVPTDDLRYDLQWTASRPRVLADFELAAAKERSAGRFTIRGRTGEKTGSKGKSSASKNEVDSGEADEPRQVSLDLITARGIIVLNVPPGEVMSDLRERPLTNAAKAIIRSGDSLLMEAIRRAAPKYYGDYSRSLPPVKMEPSFAARTSRPAAAELSRKRALIRVTDINNRAVTDLTSAELSITDSGQVRGVERLLPASAPVNIVLLLDISGSVDNYVNFIRKAARNFINTVDRNDRISIILFNDDVAVLSPFSADKNELSEKLDTFDAGGGTAYYDALAYTLAETLRPLKGERTAIVVLTDGDDNRSFLAFDTLAGSIRESGALIYPLYVPSGLIAAAGGRIEASVDPLRSRYTGLSTRAVGEGEELARLSGGVYYPISQLSDIQSAYDDIVRQLRTAYFVEFDSVSGFDASGRPSPSLRFRSSRPGSSVTVVSMTALKE